jgi:hypothetical protein
MLSQSCHLWEMRGQARVQSPEHPQKPFLEHPRELYHLITLMETHQGHALINFYLTMTSFFPVPKISSLHKPKTKLTFIVALSF